MATSSENIDKAIHKEDSKDKSMLLNKLVGYLSNVVRSAKTKSQAVLNTNATKNMNQINAAFIIDKVNGKMNTFGNDSPKLALRTNPAEAQVEVLESALQEKPYIEKQGKNDYLVMRPDMVDAFVTVVPNHIYYNIEKPCVNWLDDCSLNGIRARLLRGAQSFIF